MVLPAEVAGTGAGRRWRERAWHDRGAPGWCAGRRLFPACVSRSNAYRHRRTAHDSHSATICYRCHPLYGVEVEVVRHLQRIESAVLIVRPPTGAQIAVPEWMLIPELCNRLSYEDTPRVDLPRLIDAQHIDDAFDDQFCAESASGGQDAEQQGGPHRVAAQAALRGRGDLNRASGIDAGTLPRTVPPSSGERSQRRRQEGR